MDPQELLALLTTLGVPQEQQMAMVAMLLSGGAPTDPYLPGAEWDVKEANKGVDYSRDFNTLLADPMSGALAGMAGYGGINEMGLGAFDPIVTRTPVEGPNTALLERYLAQPTTQLGGFLADAIVNQGMSAADAVGLVSQIVTRDPTAFPLPSWQDQDGNARFDLSGVEKLASDLEAQVVARPPAGATQDSATGMWFTEESKPSPAAEWYIERGIPLPTMRYGIEDFAPEALDYQAEADRLSGEMANFDLAGANKANDQAIGAYKQYMASYRPEWSRSEQQAAVTQAQTQPSRPVALDPFGKPLPSISSGAPFVPVGDQASLGAQLPTNVSQLSNPTIAAQVAAVLGGQINPGLTPEQRAQVGPAPTRSAPQAQPSGRDTLLAQQREATEKLAAYRNMMVEQFKAAQRAKGARFMNKTGGGEAYLKGRSGYTMDSPNIAQGMIDLTAAQARGRTPTRDALMSRAMAAYLAGT